MKKIILIVVFVLVAIWALSQMYSVKSATSPDGTYNLVVVNEDSGKVYRIMGK